MNVDIKTGTGESFLFFHRLIRLAFWLIYDSSLRKKDFAYFIFQ